MVKNITVTPQCLGVILFGIALFISLTMLWSTLPNTTSNSNSVAVEPSVPDKNGIATQSGKAGEGYRNYGFNQKYGFNFKNSCRGQNEVDRLLQPLQYTFSEVPYFKKFPYFNYYNAPQVIGCGGRRIPCDTRHAIPNVLDPIDISNNNIAPTTIRVDDNLDMKLNKVGAIYKIFGNENQVFPLYGRSLYYNDSKWEYFTRMGPTGEFLRVFAQRQLEELGNNDEVKVEGRCGKYRVSIYDRYLPQYIPFI